jgi:DNA ligase-1
MTQLPTLYILTSTGAIQQWTVETRPLLTEESAPELFGEIITTYGQVNGKLQTTVDIIKSGKNLGKVNETTPVQQAALKAKQLWDKKVKEGYVENIDQAAKGQSDLEGIEPMLAFPIEKKEKYVTYPAIIQPKLDGFRCIAIVTNGKARLFSRTRKEITTLPHIIEQLEKMYNSVVLDGELYNHELKEDFPRLAGLIKRDEVHPDSKLIQYHVYDSVPQEYKEANFSWKERVGYIIEALELDKNPYIKPVESRIANSEDEMNFLFQNFVQDGYEGAIYRHPTMPYENKRSAGLLKIKTMQDAEFTIIGVKEGTGKLMGKAGAFMCVTNAGKEFEVKMKGTLESLEDYLVNFDNYKGKQLTVQFQKYTPYGAPLFPVGLRIREEE